MYHRVGTVRLAAESAYCVTPKRFAAHMLALANAGYRAVPIDRLAAWLKGGPELQPEEFVLTFDDGYLGVRDHAQRVLERLGWPYSVFLITGLLGGRDAWARFDQAEGGAYPLLSRGDVLAMRERGCSFHSHTRSHANLTMLDDGPLAAELAGSRADLAQLLGNDGPTYLAYPYGHVDDRVESAARAAGYEAAFSVQPGFNRRGENIFRIRRLNVHGDDTPAALLRKVRFGSNDGSLRQSLTYFTRRIAAHIGGRAA